MSKFIDTQEKQEIINTLKSLGLSIKESAVYISLLSLGEVGTSAIATDTKLHRQFVYDALGTLNEKGLVGHSIIRGRKKFFAHSPTKLTAMFDQKSRMAKGLVERIGKNMLPVDMQEFEVHRGNESFITNEFETLKTIKSESNIYVLGGIGDMYEKTLGKYFEEYEYQRKRKNVKVMYIGAEAQRKQPQEIRDGRNLFEYRLLPNMFSGELTITVFEDRVSFYMFGNPVTVFSIKSEKIAKSYGDFFMGLWNISK